ncbi:MAG TPA: outer membrane beta-barrel protein [Pyrinomonadaceae bacterium]|nr:outer membrane beta-barrel protein [Pyrinomonadaceae bacterium]
MKNRNILLTAVAALVITAACVSPVAAQGGGDDYYKAEFAAGYSHARAASTFESETALIPEEGPLTTRYCAQEGRDSFGADFQRFFCERKGMNGFDASATFNFGRYVGVKGNVSAHFNSQSFSDTFDVGEGQTFTANVNTRERLYQFLAGVQVKDNAREGRAVRPFAHALAGVARQTVRFSMPPSEGSDGFDARADETSFALKLGGGLDVRLSERVALRLVEVNYNPIFARDRPLAGQGITVPITVSGRTAHNFTVGVGIVFH